MSPLDNELRSLLASRAGQVAPSPDPLAGIESRARRIRRNRLAGAALASVIVIAGAGLAVPSLLPDRDSGATQFGTQQPSSTRGAPISTWQPRGNATPEALAFAKTSYGTGSPGDAVFVRLLWGGSPDNGPQVLICLAGAVGADGSEQPRDIALVYYAEDGVQQLVSTQPLTEDARQITRVVDVGSGPYVVAVGEPGTTEIAYAKDGGDDFAVQKQTEGVATFARTGPTGKDPDLGLYTFGDGDHKTVEVGGPKAGATGAYRLDPAQPWAYRGNQAALDSGMLKATQSEWSVRHPGSTLTPLFGQVYEPSGQREVAFVASGDGRTRWGYATSSKGGPEFLVDETLETKPVVLMAALPGDEVPRLFVLAAPTTGELGYAKDYRNFRTLVGPAPGVAYSPLEGDTINDAVRVLDGDGNLDKPVFLGPAPDFVARNSGSAAPDNLVTWPSRGATPDAAFLEKALTAFAQGLGAKRSDVEGKVLFAGDDDARNVFVFGQAWIKGSDAHTFGYSENSAGEATPFLGPVTANRPALLAFVVAAGAGQSRDTLIVVPTPGAAKTYYGAAQSEYTEITGQDYLKGVTLIDRSPKAQGNDMLKLVDAQGNKLFEGKVGPLLCGVKSCG